MPFVILTINEGSLIHASTGSRGNRRNEEWRIPISFAILANDKVSSANFGLKLARYFDLATINSGSRDEHVRIQRRSDILRRVGDAEYMCEVVYDLHVDRLYTWR